ncbi:unnamed protein product [Gongylonema pulchrum]|uniref:BHLH domain-containing protein n=1 Tax=Gongylonema pulchrum TaxID=637853 RepID=A0A183DPK9_9BILA|nr:unnamed protein product [Gongylonema pulchrum]
MDRRRGHSPFCLEQLICAAQYVEKARNSIQDPTILSFGSDESSADSFILTKDPPSGQISTCSSASTSSLGFPLVLSSVTVSMEKLHCAINCRAAHNELEKTRRANLRGYLDRLKEIVPPGAENARSTTLSLLTRARDYILVCHFACILQSSQEINFERKQQLEKRCATLRLVIESFQSQKTSSTEESRPGSASTISAIDDIDFGLLSSSSDNISCLNFSTKLSVSSDSSSNSSVVSSPVQSYPPVDPYVNGLLPALPLCYPRISMYPYLDVQRPVINHAPLSTAIL